MTIQTTGSGHAILVSGARRAAPAPILALANGKADTAAWLAAWAAGGAA